MVLKKITIGVPTVRPGRIKFGAQFAISTTGNTGNSDIWSFFTDFCNNGLSGPIFYVTRDKHITEGKKQALASFCMKTLKVVELKFESVFKLH